MFDYVGCIIGVVDSLPNFVKNVHIRAGRGRRMEGRMGGQNGWGKTKREQNWNVQYIVF